MITVNKIKVDENVTLLNGFDDALIGVTKDKRAIYSMSDMIDVLCKRDGMFYDEAYECIDYNVLNALPNFKNQPIIINDLD